MKLYAIYKNGIHLGNEGATSGIDAIKKFIIASQLLSFIKNEDFLKQYAFKEAKANIHFIEDSKI